MSGLSPAIGAQRERSRAPSVEAQRMGNCHKPHHHSWSLSEQWDTTKNMHFINIISIILYFSKNDDNPL